LENLHNKILKYLYINDNGNFGDYIVRLVMIGFRYINQIRLPIIFIKYER
jgi:hypothetical protein